jgi:hypothetical protein
MPPRVSFGTNNVGLLMKISGRATKVTSAGDYSGFFYVDDGSSLRDGAGWIGIKCRPPSSPAAPSNMPQQGDHVVVSGAMGVGQVSGRADRYFWTTGWQRVSPWQDVRQCLRRGLGCLESGSDCARDRLRL